MIKPLLCIAVFCLAVILHADLAKADDLRVGIMAQDIEVAGIAGVQGKEKGVAISLDYVLDSPAFLDCALDARPYIGGSINLSGDTSYGGAGLLWQTNLLNDVYGELAFGGVIHDGELEIPSPGEASTSAQALEFGLLNRNNIEFGSRVLFRTQFAIGVNLSEDWGAELVYEHLSHGKILSSGSNEGLDAAGFRIARRF